MTNDQTTAPQLKILKVDLVEASYKTHRLANGQDPKSFPVIIWFTRPLTAFERIETVNQGLEMQFGDHPMQALIEVTPEWFIRQIETINAELPGVASDAQEAWEAAQAEDEHIASLVQQINLNINPSQ